MSENIFETGDIVITTYTGPFGHGDRNRFQISVRHPDSDQMWFITLNADQYKRLALALAEEGKHLFLGGVGGQS